ncbi:hypothetical protein AGMMS49546_36290 [Spirochaetia bacterium]|nr:hypothetical protein AGMMS49546_36290 [Spirochaetia bacterium]
MRRKMPFISFVPILALLSLLVLAACELPSNDEGAKNTEAIRITGIPVNGDSTYKIFVQLSEGQDASAGYIAKGDALINGKTSVLIPLFDKNGDPWSGTGWQNMAMVISPRVVTRWQDIDAYGYQKNFSSQIQTFEWAKEFLHLNTDMPNQVQEIFSGGSGKPGIICVKESGIDYSATGITQ